MNPSYEKIAQLQHTPIVSFNNPLETFFLITGIFAAAALFYTLFEAIRCEISYLRLGGWTIKGWIIRISGLTYIKKWMQKNFFLFLDDGWNEKQYKWLKERQKEKEEAEDDRLKKHRRENKIEPMVTTMKIDKALAKYECKECGHRDQLEMSLYDDITRAAKTLCFKKLCQKCKKTQLDIVMIECRLFKRKG